MKRKIVRNPRIYGNAGAGPEASGENGEDSEYAVWNVKEDPLGGARPMLGVLGQRDDRLILICLFRDRGEPVTHHDEQRKSKAGM